MQLSISAIGGELGYTLKKDEILRDEDDETHPQDDTLLKQLIMSGILCNETKIHF